MYSDPRVKAILFTGSTDVGRQIGIECARRGKKFDLEMGGKSPLLVMKDANLRYAVDTACFGLFIHQGQICMAGSRIIAEEPVYEEFLDLFVAKTKALKVGDPRDPHTVIGPLIQSTIHDEPHGPFRGVKDSGMGREGGQWSMDDLTQLKWVTIQQGEAHYPF